MKPIIVNVDQVPEDKRDRPKFIALRDDMEKGMSDPETVKSICIHEAAHLLLALQLKMSVQGLEGPRILYDPITDDFVGLAAEVQIQVIENSIEECAMMLAAGGVASIDLAPSLGPGNEGDIARYHQLCDQVSVTDPAKRADTWQKAEQAARDYLKIDANKNAVEKIAGSLMATLENGS